MVDLVLAYTNPKNVAVQGDVKVSSRESGRPVSAGQ